MSYPGTTPTKFGRYAVAEPPRFDLVHFHKGEPLREVDHEPPVPVLDQEDLFAQGVDTSTLIPGAQKVDALGSCTANATTVSLAERWQAVLGKLPAGVTGDAVNDEEFAIRFYHACTGQTGDPSQEWPPTDCGSTGLYCCTELQKQGLVTGYATASGAQDLVSLLQAGTVIQGTPWFNSWMTPDSSAFVDGDGSQDALHAAIDSGIAGGHETCITAVEELALSATGQVDAQNTVVRVRNSWSESFGDHGSFRLHLSTLAMLGNNADFKQFVITPTQDGNVTPAPSAPARVGILAELTSLVHRAEEIGVQDWDALVELLRQHHLL